MNDKYYSVADIRRARETEEYRVQAHWYCVGRNVGRFDGRVCPEAFADAVIEAWGNGLWSPSLADIYGHLSAAETAKVGR